MRMLPKSLGISL